MRRRSTTGRRRLADAIGDPLDGLVNLFDIGVVLAVAFLIAGLSSTVDPQSGTLKPREAETTAESKDREVPSPSQQTPASGRGKAVGTVYELEDGRLVYTAP